MCTIFIICSSSLKNVISCSMPVNRDYYLCRACSFFSTWLTCSKHHFLSPYMKTIIHPLQQIPRSVLALALSCSRVLSHSSVCMCVWMYGCTLASSCEYERVVATVEDAQVSVRVSVFAAKFPFGRIITLCRWLFCDILYVSGNVMIFWELFSMIKVRKVSHHLFVTISSWNFSLW